MASTELPRNEDESSPQPSQASSEFVNCPQCQLELNSPQVCRRAIFLSARGGKFLLNLNFKIFLVFFRDMERKF